MNSRIKDINGQTVFCMSTLVMFFTEFILSSIIKWVHFIFCSQKLTTFREKVYHWTLEPRKIDRTLDRVKSVLEVPVPQVETVWPPLTRTASVKIINLKSTSDGHPEVSFPGKTACVSSENVSDEKSKWYVVEKGMYFVWVRTGFPLLCFETGRRRRSSFR